MSEESPKKSIFKVILEASALGINFVLCVIIGAVLGYLIDKFVFGKTFPLFSLIFLAAGFVAGVKEIFRFIRKVNKADGQGSNKESQ
ncbi:putative F0F1-ATPase subunit Ca2+/Mg2+ transporter [Thermodesulfovibrio aggregans]|uniref:Putative F0F1-ATPase subunit Ca2+/Mg2+ transporter n=1 Tax=Thermodesulfovibrio aggregans TaxID=86166 RepID=A0A0U9HNL2_9BACT|nr:AtpZ/AtpI family protein [Thermodesulfovibrio aggregans]GAQ94640.1 putative F0F1-ATPase subunit Ca2+/Mg2+ transporter [Thermodesulfovibrio aggregans]